MSRTSSGRQRERSEWIERTESVSALEGAGFFAMASPEEVGGHDVHPATQVEAFERLAGADVSGGWLAMIQAETPGMVGAHLRDGIGLDAVFGHGFPRIADSAYERRGAFRLGRQPQGAPLVARRLEDG